MLWLYILLGAIGLLILMFLITSILVAKGSFYNKEKIRENVPNYPDQQKDIESVIEQLKAIEKEPYEDIYISSFDNKRLRGMFYKYNDSKRIAIMFHGFQGTPIRDFSVGFWLVKNMGFNILLVDERAHGLSDGRIITMGVKERFDIKSWADYVANAFPNSEVVLIGISMGAASLLMATDLELPKNVKCIIADCPYASSKDIVCKTCKDDLHVPLFIGWPIVFVGALFLGFNLTKGDARKSIKKATIPCLIIHGESDPIVPPRMSEEIYLANPMIVERYTFPGARHGLSYVADPERYEKITGDFLKKYI